MNQRLLKHSFSLLHVDHVKLNRKWNYTNVISPYFRIYFIDEGEGFLSHAKETLKLEAPYLYIVPSFTLCNLSCPDYLSQYFLHFFEESPDGISLFQNNRTPMKVPAKELDIANVRRLYQINPGRGINRSDNPKVYEKNDFYKSYKELNLQQSDATSMETAGILMQLLSRFLASPQFKRKDELAVPSKIVEAMSYIQLHLDQDLTVAHLAARANQHPDYFSRVFLEHTGERPLTYIHEKRIERAQYLITTTNLSDSEIAAETGFEHQPYFSRIFKKVTSLTPGQYRRLNQSVHTLDEYTVPQRPHP
ncbi:AraC family transcriptional regulator [Paraflavisolibacter sp. H34]|uniref:AraC family transcriptional regulator n=1 Tax=Huijunlia imazamoxiresistens TaxID=3127457 RepID=UPI003017C3D3